MHTIEPFYNWQHIYNSEHDEHSPYYGTVHSEFEFTNTVYNYYVHPQWDSFGSENLYVKILFADYDDHCAVLEFIGEWNDVMDNDSAILKRNLIDVLIQKKIYKYILIGENVMSLFAGDVEYYEEWYEDIRDEEGYIVMLNLNELCSYEWQHSKIKHFVSSADIINWRTYKPDDLFDVIEAKWL
ncbi:MAG: hypothetical protein RL660_3189 [Bacteroidota bacterium]|jgi:hypothetical protein